MRWAEGAGKLVVLALAVLLPGCDPDGAPELPDARSLFGAAPDGGPEFDPDNPTAADLYSLHMFPEIRIELDEEALASLRSKPYAFVEGRVSIGDTVLDHVGVRLKGTTSFQPIGRKAAFKIKFNEYVPGQRFLELESITLNNMLQDRSMVHEWLAYQIFRAAGVAASRTGYAKVWLNDAYYGVYLNLESNDDVFLARNYGDPTGNLYEGNNGADVTLGAFASFNLDEGEDVDRSDLSELAHAVDELGAEVLYGSDARFDRGRVLAYLAAEAIAGHFDGYRSGRNFRIYHEPATGNWSLLPWGMDQAMVQSVSPFEANETVLPFHGRRALHRLCFESKQCRAEFAAVAEDLLYRIETLHLDDSVREVAQLILSAALIDEGRPYSDSQLFEAMEAAAAFARDRPSALRPMLDCEDNGKERDDDGDQHGACRQDCDDSDPSVYVGAAEICDGRDNDCNGFIDDAMSCPCARETVAGAEFEFCNRKATAEEARARCAELGLALAHFDDAEQNRAVFQTAQRHAYDAWWIGLNDCEEEGEFAWPGGATPTFENWHWDEPGGGGGGRDCVFMKLYSDGTWRDADCEEKFPFICREAGGAAPDDPGNAGPDAGEETNGGGV